MLSIKKLKNYIRLPMWFKATHQTSGLPNFPAIDVYAPEGTLVYPPEGGILVHKHFIEWDLKKRVGGYTVYLQGRSGNTYFLTHFSTVRREGRIYRWQSIGRVAGVPRNYWPTHIHEGKHKGIYNP